MGSPSPPDSAGSVAHEQLQAFVRRFIGTNSHGVRSLRYATSKELHDNSTLRRRVKEGASKETLDAATRAIVTDAIRNLGAGVQALAGTHPESLGQSHPRRRKAARQQAKLKDQGHFNSTLEPLYIDAIVEALAPMVGVETARGRQLQHEYEVLSRESDYSIDIDDHLRVEHWTKVRIQALGTQVRLFHGLYNRQINGRPPKPEILSNGHNLFGGPVLESEEDSRYFFGIFLGRALGIGEEETIEYRSTFKDREPCAPFFWLGLHNPYDGHMKMTVRLPADYIKGGLLFRITDPSGEVDYIIWTTEKGFGNRRLPQAKVDREPRRAIVRWTINPARMGYKYEVRWTNESVDSLETS